jgi:hypothetical protein
MTPGNSHAIEALCLALGILLMPWVVASDAVASPPQQAMRGVTIGPIESSQQPGRGYGTPYTEALLDELVRLGVNAISITPFGRIWSLRSTEIMLDFEVPYEDNRRAIGNLVAQAKARGLRVLLIPHLWVETVGWRGEIDPGSPQGWHAYQESYRNFILAWARDAQRFGVDAFSIGVECKSWSGRFGDVWDRLIGDVRHEFHGALTYSANWDEAEDVLFWDRLDYVGVNAFYPLASNNAATYAQYAEGANAALDRLGALAQTLQMPVLLAEIGYTTRSNAAIEPWLWPDAMHDVQVDEWEQARALHALASAAASREFIKGLYVWRYYANLDDVSQESAWGFSPHGKLAELVLGRTFNQTWAADPSPDL